MKGGRLKNRGRGRAAHGLSLTQRPHVMLRLISAAGTVLAMSWAAPYLLAQAARAETQAGDTWGSSSGWSAPPRQRAGGARGAIEWEYKHWFGVEPEPEDWSSHAGPDAKPRLADYPTLPRKGTVEPTPAAKITRDPFSFGATATSKWKVKYGYGFYTQDFYLYFKTKSLADQAPYDGLEAYCRTRIMDPWEFERPEDDRWTVVGTVAFAGTLLAAPRGKASLELVYQAALDSDQREDALEILRVHVGSTENDVVITYDSRVSFHRDGEPVTVDELLDEINSHYVSSGYWELESDFVEDEETGDTAPFADPLSFDVAYFIDADVARLTLFCDKYSEAFTRNPGDSDRDKWRENFDGYPTGSGLHGQGGWKGWDNDPAFDADVTDAQSRSAPHSVDIKDNADMVREFSGVDSGKWSFSVWQYIPADFFGPGSEPFDGHFLNLLNTYNDGGPYHWSAAIKLDSDSSLLKVFHGDGLNTIDVPYITDRWVEIRAEIDLDNDLTQIYYDAALITEYPWTPGFDGAGGGVLNIAALDLWANGSTSVYYDDFLLERVIEDDCDPCDMNCDGAVNAFDIESFLDLLFGGGEPCAPCTGDANGDGNVDAFDIEPFLECLFP